MKALPLGGYVKIAGMNPYQPVAARGPAARVRLEADLAAGAGDRSPGRASHFLIAAVLFTAWLVFAGDPLTADAGRVAEVAGDAERPSVAGRRRRAAAGRRRSSGSATADPSGEELSSYTTCARRERRPSSRPVARRADPARSP